jgi:hypothetical protein
MRAAAEINTLFYHSIPRTFSRTLASACFASCAVVQLLCTSRKPSRKTHLTQAAVGSSVQRQPAHPTAPTNSAPKHDYGSEVTVEN